MSKQKQKGTHGENEIVKKHLAIGVAAERVPLSGLLGGKYSSDVCIPSINDAIFRCEVKSRKSRQGFAVIADWLGKSDILFIREDYKPPLVIMPWIAYEKLIQVYMNEHKPTTN